MTTHATPRAESPGELVITHSSDNPGYITVTDTHSGYQQSFPLPEEYYDPANLTARDLAEIHLILGLISGQIPDTEPAQDAGLPAAEPSADANS